jgi:predicted GTPase
MGEQAMQTTDDFIKIFRREGWGIPELEKQKAHYAVGSPGHMAAVQLIAEKKELEEQARTQREETRHREAMTTARGANHIAKWAIVVAVLALIVAVIQAFWH